MTPSLKKLLNSYLMYDIIVLDLWRLCYVPYYIKYFTKIQSLTTLINIVLKAIKCTILFTCKSIKKNNLQKKMGLEIGLFKTQKITTLLEVMMCFKSNRFFLIDCNCVTGYWKYWKTSMSLYCLPTYVFSAEVVFECFCGEVPLNSWQ